MTQDEIKNNTRSFNKNNSEGSNDTDDNSEHCHYNTNKTQRY